MSPNAIHSEVLFNEYVPQNIEIVCHLSLRSPRPALAGESLGSLSPLAPCPVLGCLTQAVAESGPSLTGTLGIALGLWGHLSGPLGLPASVSVFWTHNVVFH